MSDLDEAIDIFDMGVYTSRFDKRFIDPAVAHGLRARANLCQGLYTEAADDASMALQLTDGANCGVNVVNKPAFNSFTQSDSHVGIHISEQDVHGLYTFAGMMGSLTYGYAYAGQWRCINAKLWDMIPEGDVRKGWWQGNEPDPDWLDEEKPDNSIYVYKSNVDNYTPGGLRPQRGTICPLWCRRNTRCVRLSSPMQWSSSPPYRDYILNSYRSYRHTSDAYRRDGASSLPNARPTPTGRQPRLLWRTSSTPTAGQATPPMYARPHRRMKCSTRYGSSAV